MKIILLVCLCFFSISTFAEVRLELTQGKDARVPVAVVPFYEEGTVSVPISQVISADLNHSGRFISSVTHDSKHTPYQTKQVEQGYWRGQGYDDLIIGHIKSLPKGRYQLTYSLVDLFGQDLNPVLSSQTYTVPVSQLRQAAHAIANDIYYQLTGYRGFFTSSLAYILVQNTTYGKRYKLIVSDYDGHNPQVLVDSNVPIISPRWSPDDSKIVYVTFNRHGSVIYDVVLATGRREKIADYKGVNGAPAWSPDGKRLAVVLSKSGSPDIYLLNLQSKRLVRLTDDSNIDNEPAFSPDGHWIYFTSNRHGSPQIYRMNLAGANMTRITNIGNYNASTAVDPNAKQIAVLHRLPKQRLFSIAVLDLKRGFMQALTKPGLNQSPSYAPNGQMIVYASQQGTNTGRISMVSLNGKSTWMLADLGKGSMQEPDWSH